MAPFDSAYEFLLAFHCFYLAPLAVLVEHRLVTDRMDEWTDRHTMTAYTKLA